MASISMKSESYLNDMITNANYYRGMNGNNSSRIGKFFSIARWWYFAGFLFVLFSIGAVIMGILGNTSYTLAINSDQTEEVGIGTFNYNNKTIVEGINSEVADKNYSQILAYVKGLSQGQRVALVDNANLRIQNADALELTDPARNWAIVSANSRKSFVDAMLEVENDNTFVIIGISIVSIASVASIILLVVTLLKRKGKISSKNGLDSNNKNSTATNEPMY